MKKIFLLAGSVLLLAAFSLKKDPPAGRAGKAFVPPGTVNINDTLFADETEVSNFSWKEFVTYNKLKYGDNSQEYKSVLQDTLVWRDVMTYNEPYVTSYHSHVAYNNYPVVGVSYEQATRFCKWRTERVHILQEIKEGKRKTEDVNKEYTGKFKFEYRLPTKQEWEAMAMVGYTDQEKVKYQKNNYSMEKEGSKKIPLPDYNLITSGMDVTIPVSSGIKTRLGVKNMIGNVAEMVTEKGVAKGGSWKSLPEDVTIWKDQTYEKANAWTGFRCVCVVRK